MKKILGIFGLLVLVVLVTAIAEPASFLTAFNIENVVRRTSLYGILSIGVAFVIITGGIDLSIGSVVALSASLLPWLLVGKGWSVPAALGVVGLVSLAIGLTHGLLVAKLKLQPFVVTLCGLLFYRGIARWITADAEQGFGTGYTGLRKLARGEIPLWGEFGIPVPFVILMVLAVAAAIFLNRTVWGRYLLALGRNEQAARYSGIQTDRMVILAYVISALLAGLGSILFAFDLGSVQPSSFGNFYELNAIAAAVLGGCSLRGGEGSILGVLIGAALMQMLNNAIILLGIPSQLELAIVGTVILGGVVTDEVFRRLAAQRRRRWSAQPADNTPAEQA